MQEVRDVVTLKVVEGMVSDAHKGIVRILADVMKQLDLKTGDLVLIEGERCTVARVLPAFSNSCPKGSIQLDGVIRQNAKVKIGEEVKILPITWERARGVVLTPTVEGWIPHDDSEIDFLKQKMIGIPVMVEDIVKLALFSGKYETFIVEGVMPKGIVLIDKDTMVTFKGSEGAGYSKRQVSYEDIGGLSKEIKKIREIVEIPLKYPRLFSRLGIDAPKGIFLYGPPGNGKTLIARAVACETQAHFIHVNGPEIMNKYYGESEARLRKVFDEARKKAPSIIFLDEIDAIAPRRTDVHGDVEKRVVAQLLALMDGMESRGNVIVLAATNIPDLVDPALRRPGRFDREISISAPNQQGRLEILQIHTRGTPLCDDVSLENLAENTHGFVGADLQALCQEAGMSALRRLMTDPCFEGDNPGSLSFLKVMKRDFVNALSEVEPSATREFSIETPNIRWEEVGGLDEIIEQLQVLVEWPFIYPKMYKKFGLCSPKGILLSGPPGTGKTLVAKALASESKLNFIPVSAPLLFSHWMGETEKALHDVFKRAMQASPSILFFDEIDALVPRRREDKTIGSRLVSQFLTEIDGLEELKEVIVLAATNRIDMIDPALLRPGRFDMVLEFPLPDAKGRLEILKVHLKGRPIAEDVNLQVIVDNTEGITGSGLKAIVDRAAFESMRETIRDGSLTKVPILCIQQKHLLQAMNEIIDDRRRFLKN